MIDHVLLGTIVGVLLHNAFALERICAALAK
jgi:hypothetical protein